MESGAKGCEVVVSGKLRAARAKSMKFTVCFFFFFFGCCCCWKEEERKGKE